MASARGVAAPDPRRARRSRSAGAKRVLPALWLLVLGPAGAAGGDEREPPALETSPATFRAETSTLLRIQLPRPDPLARLEVVPLPVGGPVGPGEMLPPPRVIEGPHVHSPKAGANTLHVGSRDDGHGRVSVKAFQPGDARVAARGGYAEPPVPTASGDREGLLALPGEGEWIVEVASGDATAERLTLVAAADPRGPGFAAPGGRPTDGFPLALRLAPQTVGPGPARVELLLLSSPDRVEYAPIERATVTLASWVEDGGAPPEEHALRPLGAGRYGSEMTLEAGRSTWLVNATRDGTALLRRARFEYHVEPGPVLGAARHGTDGVLEADLLVPREGDYLLTLHSPASALHVEYAIRAQATPAHRSTYVGDAVVPAEGGAGNVRVAFALTGAAGPLAGVADARAVVAPGAREVALVEDAAGTYAARVALPPGTYEVRFASASLGIAPDDSRAARIAVTAPTPADTAADRPPDGPSAGRALARWLPLALAAAAGGIALWLLAKRPRGPG